MNTSTRLSEILYKPIPLPAFLETEIQLRNLINNRCLEHLWLKIDNMVRDIDSKGRNKRLPVRAAKLFAIEGRICGTKNGGFSIDNTSFLINADTFVIGEIKTNAFAKVKGLRLGNGEMIATSVCVATQA